MPLDHHFSGKFAIFGGSHQVSSLLASIFSLQMLFNAATLHEQVENFFRLGISGFCLRRKIPVFL